MKYLDGTPFAPQKKPVTKYLDTDSSVTPRSLFELELSNDTHLQFLKRELLEFKDKNAGAKLPFYLEQQKDMLITIEKLNQLQTEHPLVLESSKQTILDEILNENVTDEEVIDQANDFAKEILKKKQDIQFNK
jgi:PP-loop superfamily ATP-utilizing enzyme